MSSIVRSSIAALLLSVPVVAESVHLVRSSGWPEIVFVLAQLLGWVLVLSVVRDLRTVAGGHSRWGAGLVVAGVGFQLVFALAYLVTLLWAGEASEASFLALLLGFVLLSVGGARWSWRLRLSHPRAALGLAGVALFGLLAMLVGDNLVHEVALPLSYLAWILVGRGASSASRPAGVRLSAGSR